MEEIHQQIRQILDLNPIHIHPGKVKKCFYVEVVLIFTGSHCSTDAEIQEAHRDNSCNSRNKKRYPRSCVNFISQTTRNTISQVIIRAGFAYGRIQKKMSNHRAQKDFRHHQR